MIKQLTLSGFTTFAENQFNFCKGVNVIIGLNGTGKTHLLKSMEATIQAGNTLYNSSSQAKERFEGLLADNLIEYFKPMQLGRLVKRQQGRTNSNISLKFRKGEIKYGFATNSKTSVRLQSNTVNENIQTLYIPPREMFSLYEGFIGLARNREVPFDATYLKFAEALQAPVLKGPRAKKQADLIAPLEKALNLSVLKENGRFYIKDHTGKMEAPLVAEGVRKLASIMYLILNGELNKNSALFWDEPESNLNPSLTKVVAEFIKILAKNGVQIFISTHDYLLIHLLSMDAEYKEFTNPPDMKFFSLNKNREGNIDVEEGESLLHIQNNPILDEFEAYYDLQQTMINRKITNQ